MADRDSPVFSAVSSSARQLYLLLRCISFAPKAQVQISEEGLRFTASESSVLEGMVFLEKALFTTFQYKAPRHSTPDSDASVDEQEDEIATNPTFAISLPSLLETLQIFGLSTENNANKPNAYRRDGYNNAFSHDVLGISGSCSITWEKPGNPLTVILQEAQITTTCDLVTYEPLSLADIPFNRENLVLKVIMRASYLHDAITELSSTNPQSLTLTASPTSLILSASSTLGSAIVEFDRDSKTGHISTNRNTNGNGNGTDKQGSGLLETFHVPEPFSQSYKFSHVGNAKKALASATKVSVRADEQGVLSLQFMIENLEGGGVSFVDYRFVPLVGEEGDETSTTEEEGEEE
ncbi:Rad1-domain-containing protein [Tothia fuscella]|uniref:Rad1-domain-containing protein n=1 Tax=Tothia fuscella TaxID=1048955 RepID=A0A9P4U3S4_9PEZI|nr:Rad1-domain-containing protein [Tothia fuscella]